MFAESKLIIESENCPDWHQPPSVSGQRGRRDNYRHNKHVIKRGPVSFDFQTDLNLWPLCSSLAAKLFETRFAFLFLFRCSLEFWTWGMSEKGMRMMKLSPGHRDSDVWVSGVMRDRGLTHGGLLTRDNVLVTSHLCPVIVRNSETTQSQVAD